MKKFKLKTNRASAKRFQVTSKGRIKRKRAYLRHGMRKRNQDTKRVLRQKTYVSSSDTVLIKVLLPNN